MTLLDLNINLSRTNELLERIALAIERVSPAPDLRERRLRGPEDIVDISPGAVTRRNRLDSYLDLQGVSLEEREAAKREIDELPDAVKETFLMGLERDEEEG